MRKLPLLIIASLILFAGWYVVRHNNGTDKPAGVQAFNKKQYSIDSPSSIWIVVNKQRPLEPKNFAPDDLVTPSLPLRLGKSSSEMKLRKPAADALAELDAGAKKDGLSYMVSSAYRSYAYQVSLYDHYVQTQGKATADSESARPGHSEHQTGLAVDLEPKSRECEVETCFGDLPEGKWLAANAYKYGFVIRYPKDGQDITGYVYEPWHIRYVGKALAAELHKQHDPTLEEFFGLPDAPDYE